MLNKNMWLVVGFFSFFTVFFHLRHGVADNSCICPVIECGACEVKVKDNFYTENCEQGRVRSCKKPVCEPISDETELRACQANLGKDQPLRTVASPPAEAKPEAPVEQVHFVDTPAGQNASVGALVMAQGDAYVVRKSGKKDRARVGVQVYVRDTLVTEDGAKLKLKFINQNMLTLVPSSKILIAAHEQSADKEKKSTMLHLLYGTARSQVNEKYKGNQNSFYKIKTGTAVAGVRGTDFITSFLKSGHGEYTTKIQTLTGAVELADHSNAKKQMVSAGETVSHIVPNIGDDLFSAQEIADFRAQGFLTPVHKLKASEVQKILEESPEDLRIPAGSEDHVSQNNQDQFECREPAGRLNECAWTCVGGSAKHKTCRTDLKGVQCVRKRCNANGVWADEFRLPSHYSEKCEAFKPKVGPCDY